MHVLVGQQCYPNELGNHVRTTWNTKISSKMELLKCVQNPIHSGSKYNVVSPAKKKKRYNVVRPVIMSQNIWFKMEILL